MSNPRMKTTQHIVKAGGALTVAAGGPFILNVSSTAGDGELTVRLGDGDKLFFDAGANYEFTDAEAFDSITLVNSGASDATVMVAVGRGKVGVSSQAQITNTVAVAQTKSAKLNDAADVNAPNGSAGTLLAANTARRKVILVSDPANTANARIGAAPTATRGALLQPGQSIELETTAAIKGWGIGATVSISMTWTED